MATPSILSIRTSFSVHLQPVTWSDWHVECILTVCRKTRTKVITTPAHNKNKYNKDPIKLKVKTSKLPDARKNAGYQAAIGLYVAPSWLVEKKKEVSFQDQELSEANLRIPGLLKNNSSWWSWYVLAFLVSLLFVLALFICSL